jgi:hypothetical protein
MWNQRNNKKISQAFTAVAKLDVTRSRRLFAGFSSSTAVVHRQVVAVDESNTAADSVCAFSRPNPPTLCYLICVSTSLLFCFQCL